MVRESFARMKGFRLSTHSKMIKTFAVFIVMMFVFGTAEGLMKAKGAGQSVIIAVQAMITGTVGLVMSLYAIQFVAGKDVLTAEDAENAEEEDAENI